MAVRRKRIERLVDTLLAEYEVEEPPVPIDAIAAGHDIDIRYQALESDLCGFLYRDTDGTVVGVNSHHARVRQRFTIAHELGHHLLHEGDTLFVDRMVLGKLRNNLSSQGTDPEEIEANHFAAAILMPQEFIARDLENAETGDLLDERFIAGLAKRYEVSSQAMLLRLVRLGYVEE